MTDLLNRMEAHAALHDDLARNYGADDEQLQYAADMRAVVMCVRVLREAIQNAISASDDANAELAEQLLAQGITSIPITELTAKAFNCAQALRAALEATK